MRTTALLLSLALAFAAFGQLTPGPNVKIEFWSAQLGDVNGDRLTDFLHGRVMLVNEGNGNFTRYNLGLPGDDTVIETLDVNGDGLSDFLVSDRPSAPPGSVAATKSYRLHIMGEGMVYGPAIELGQHARHPYIADVNGDGKDDLVLTEPVLQGWDSVSTKVTVLRSNGDGTFSARPSFEIPPHPYSGNTLRLRTGDLNHDGNPDLVIRTAHELAILLGIGNGDFAPVSRRYVPTRQFGNAAVELADIDGDGHLDIVLAGASIIRVFLGDGTGRFPRLTSAPIDGGYYNIKIGIGQFVRSGRTEIVAGTYKGELIVLAYENKKLREVAKRQTEFLSTNVFVGAFLQPQKTDLYVSGSTWRDHWTNPRLFFVDSTLPAAAPAIVGGRSRAVRGFAAGPATNFDVRMLGDACVTTTLDNWSLWRDGIFGMQRTAERTVEMAHEGDVISVRFTVPWSAAPVIAHLERRGNDYVGVTHATTACGSSEIELTVTPH
jgi:hypothetical protein